MELEQIIPQGKRCAIEPYEQAMTSSAGLALQNTSNETAAPCIGKILQAGKESAYKVGQQVAFIRYSAYSIKAMTPEGQKEIIIIEDDEVLCIIEQKGRIIRKTNETTIPIGPVKKSKKVGKKAKK